MKKFLLTLLFSIVALSACAGNTSPERIISGEPRMIVRLIGEGDTEGWGSDLGVPFMHKGKLYFLGGDTNAGGVFAPNIIGVTDDLDPSDGMSITWRKDERGNPKEFFTIIEPASTVPAGAISISDKMYIFMMDVINWDYPAIARAVLVRSQDDGRTFQTVWEGDRDNKFVNIAPVIAGHPIRKGQEAVYLIGSGKYRESPIYLAATEIDGIENRAGYVYFAGLENGSPVWKESENEALPIVDGVKVGELSVQWNRHLGKWLLSYFDYSAGESANMYLRTASELWGPWSNPVLVFSGSEHYDWYQEVITRQGRQSWGIPYGSYLLPETGNANDSKVYFTLSLWIPYAIFLMEAELDI